MAGGTVPFRNIRKTGVSERVCTPSDGEQLLYDDDLVRFTVSHLVYSLIYSSNRSIPFLVYLEIYFMYLR